MTIDTEHPLSVLTSAPKPRICWESNGESWTLFGVLQVAEASPLLFWPSRGDPESDDEMECPRPEPGQLITIEAPTDLGIFEIPAQVALTDLIGCMALTPTGKVRRIQRREYARVQIEAATLGWALDAAGSTTEELALSLIDLSGGGTRFATPTPLDVGAAVRVSLGLVGEPVIEPTVVIVDSFVSSLGAVDRYVCRGYFRDFDETARDRVIRFVMREQIVQRRRQLPA